MTTFTIEDIHDINIETTLYETKIDIKNFKGTMTRIELSKNDAELLLERLREVLNKV